MASLWLSRGMLPSGSQPKPRGRPPEGVLVYGSSSGLLPTAGTNHERRLPTLPALS